MVPGCGNTVTGLSGPSVSQLAPRMVPPPSVVPERVVWPNALVMAQASAITSTAANSNGGRVLGAERMVIPSDKRCESGVARSLARAPLVFNRHAWVDRAGERTRRGARVRQ